VLTTSARAEDVVLKLELADARTGNVVETIVTTRNHPLFVHGKGFVPAGQLAIGNAIATRAGPELIVKSIVRKSDKAGIAVYNFVVEDDHTYFVGRYSGGIWVHNPGNCGTNKVAGDQFRDELANELKKYGFQVRTEQGQWTPFGRRVTDIRAYEAGETEPLFGVEAKVGTSRYHQIQQDKDAWIELFGQPAYPTYVIRR
jgi:hypothetical protein